MPESPNVEISIWALPKQRLHGQYPNGGLNVLIGASLNLIQCWNWGTRVIFCWRTLTVLLQQMIQCLTRRQDTIEECCFHPDLQIPKVCYQINKTQVSHSWCLFKPKNRHGVTLIGILRGREGQHVSGVWRSHQSIWISNNTKIDVSTIEMGFLAIIRLWWTSLLATIDCI